MLQIEIRLLLEADTERIALTAVQYLIYSVLVLLARGLGLLLLATHLLGGLASVYYEHNSTWQWVLLAVEHYVVAPKADHKETDQYGEEDIDNIPNFLDHIHRIAVIVIVDS